MNTHLYRLARIFVTVLALATTLVLSGTAAAQCPGTTLTGGLQGPSKIVQTNLGNLIVSETGTTAPNSGRISIVSPHGVVRPLLQGTPSGINSVGEPSGPAGLFMHGRTLYVLNSEGDATLPGPSPGTEIPNPNPSSPIISSIMALQFSANTERITTGFTLTLADHQALKNGARLTLDNGHGDRMTIELVVDFPNYVPDPLPFFHENVRHSNPYGLFGAGEGESAKDHDGHEGESTLYVADAGLNAVRKVDIATGAEFILTHFPNIPNPTPGPPFIEAVPTSVVGFNDRLLVTLFRGFPFVPGTADVVSVHPVTGAQQDFIGDLTSVIDVLPVESRYHAYFLTLEISTNLLMGEPGRLQRFNSPAGPGIVISNCLIGPSAMVRDSRNGTLYITEQFTGRIIEIPGL